MESEDYVPAFPSPVTTLSWLHRSIIFSVPALICRVMVTTIRSEWLTTVGAGVRINRFPIHAVWVAVPPGSPAGIRTELPRFLLGDDFYQFSAVLAGNRVLCRITQTVAAAE